MWFIGVEIEHETSAPPPKKILDPPLKLHRTRDQTLHLKHQTPGNAAGNRSASWPQRETSIIYPLKRKESEPMTLYIMS